MSEKCGAKNRSGGQCARPAGWGTNHAGVGKCKLHGGASRVKHGLYSKYTKHKLSEVVQSLIDNPELTNLREQIAFKQALVLNRLDQLKENLTAEDTKFLSELSERVSRDIERQHKIEHGEKYVLQVEEVQAVVQQITTIVIQEVRDQEIVERIGNRLQDLKW